MKIRSALGLQLFVVMIGLGEPVSYTVGAAEFEDASFSLRFPAAISRFAPYGDVAATGGASAGSKWSSSINPASADVVKIESRGHVAFSPQYSTIRFEEGPALRLGAGTISYNAGSAGTFEVSGAQLSSNSEKSLTPLRFSFGAEFAQLRWAKSVTPDHAIGAAVSFTHSEVDTRVQPPGLDPLGFPVLLPLTDFFHSEGETYTFRIGSLHKLAKPLRAGLTAEYAYSPTKTTFFDLSGLGLPDVLDRQSTNQMLVRPGVSFEIKKDTFIYADYQLGLFWNEDENLTVHRFYFGGEYSFGRWLYVRGGVAYDMRGNTSWTSGIGIYPVKWLTLDLGYQRHMFPELEVEFGKSETLTVSISVQF